MEFKDIKQWIVSEDKLARPVNRFSECIPSLLSWVNKEYERFEQFAQQHTYATNLEHGIYDGDKVEVIWQYFDGEEFRNEISEDERLNSIKHGLRQRQFIRLKQQPKEQEMKVQSPLEYKISTCNGVTSYNPINPEINTVGRGVVQSLNPKANAIKVINKEVERLAELRETYLNGTQWDKLTNQLQILKRVLKLLQS